MSHNTNNDGIELTNMDNKLDSNLQQQEQEQHENFSPQQQQQATTNGNVYIIPHDEEDDDDHDSEEGESDIDNPPVANDGGNATNQHKINNKQTTPKKDAKKIKDTKNKNITPNTNDTQQYDDTDVIDFYNDDITFPDRSPFEKSVSLLRLFQFCTIFDILLLIIGTIAAFGSGIAFPVLAYFFGKLFDLIRDPTRYIYHEWTADIHDYGIIFAIIAAATGICSFISILIFDYVRERQVCALRLTFLRSIYDKDVTFFDLTSTDKIASRFVRDISMFRIGIGQHIVHILSDFSAVVASAVVALLTGWEVSVCFFLAFAILVIFVGAVFPPASGRDQTHELTGIYNNADTISRQAFRYIRYIVANSMEIFIHNKLYMQQMNKIFNITTKLSLLVACGQSLFMGIMMFLYVIALVCGALSVTDNMPFSSGQMITIIWCFYILSSHVMKKSKSHVAIKTARIALYRILHTIYHPSICGKVKTTKTITTTKNNNNTNTTQTNDKVVEMTTMTTPHKHQSQHIIIHPSAEHPSNQTALQLSRDVFIGGISFQNVSFHYPSLRPHHTSQREEQQQQKLDDTNNSNHRLNQQHNVLQNFTYTFLPYTTTALYDISHNHNDKSSRTACLQLMERFYDPKEGNIFIEVDLDKFQKINKNFNYSKYYQDNKDTGIPSIDQTSFDLYNNIIDGQVHIVHQINTTNDNTNNNNNNLPLHLPIHLKTLQHTKKHRKKKIGWINLRHLNIAQYRQMCIGLLTSQPMVFSGTILENLKYHHPRATQANVESIAHTCGMHDFIMQHPLQYGLEIDNYVTLLHNNNSNNNNNNNNPNNNQKKTNQPLSLTYEQSQRIALIRTLLPSPNMILFDNVTSQLSGQSAAKFQYLLTQLAESHRFGSIIVTDQLIDQIQCDVMVVLKDGKVFTAGTRIETLINLGITSNNNDNANNSSNANNSNKKDNLNNNNKSNNNSSQDNKLLNDCENTDYTDVDAVIADIEVDDVDGIKQAIQKAILVNIEKDNDRQNDKDDDNNNNNNNNNITTTVDSTNSNESDEFHDAPSTSKRNQAQPIKDNNINKYKKNTHNDDDDDSTDDDGDSDSYDGESTNSDDSDDFKSVVHTNLRNSQNNSNNNNASHDQPNDGLWIFTASNGGFDINPLTSSRSTSSSMFRFIKEIILSQGILFFFATLCAIAEGLSIPTFAVIMAKILIKYDEIDLTTTLFDRIFDYGVYLAILVAITTFVIWLKKSSLFFIAERTVFNLRKKMMANLLKQEMGFFEYPSNSPDALSYRLHHSTKQVYKFIHEFYSIAIPGIVTAGIAILYSISLSWQMGLLLLSLSPLIALSTSYYNYNFMNSFDNKVKSIILHTNRLFFERLYHHHSIIATNGEEQFLKKFETAQHEIINAGVTTALTTGITCCLISFIMVGCWGLAFQFGMVFAQTASVTIQDVITILLMMVMASLTFGKIFEKWHILHSASFAFDELYSLMDRVPKGFNDKDTKQLLLPKEHYFKPKKTFKIEFENVNFHYPTLPAVNIVNNFSLTIDPKADKNQLAVTNTTSANQEDTTTTNTNENDTINSTKTKDNKTIQSTRTKNRAYVVVLLGDVFDGVSTLPYLLSRLHSTVQPGGDEYNNTNDNNTQQNNKKNTKENNNKDHIHITISSPDDNNTEQTTPILLPRDKTKAGRILINGKDIDHIPINILRNEITMCSYRSPIFWNETIYENIKCSSVVVEQRTDGFTEKDVIAAAKMAYLHNAIEKLPRAYNIPVVYHKNKKNNENNNNYNENKSTKNKNDAQQKQQQQQQSSEDDFFTTSIYSRIILARAFLRAKQSRIMIFEQPLTHLDNKIRQKIYHNLFHDSYMKNKIVFIIAPDLKHFPIDKANKIVVFDNGKVIQQGTHDELMVDVHHSKYQSIIQQNTR